MPRTAVACEVWTPHYKSVLELAQHCKGVLNLHAYSTKRTVKSSVRSKTSRSSRRWGRRLRCAGPKEVLGDEQKGGLVESVL
jgi:hypothetical protein